MSIFHSFEARIANEISSFKLRKKNLFYGKYTSPILTEYLQKLLSQI